MAKYKVTTDQGTYMVTTDDGAGQPQAAGNSPAQPPIAPGAAPQSMIAPPSAQPTAQLPGATGTVNDQPQGPGIGETIRAGAERFLKTPALPIITGTATGLATSAASPLVSMPAAGLAGAAGEAARQIGLRAVSSKQGSFFEQGNPDLPQTATDAAKLIAQRGLEQGAAEGVGRVAAVAAKPVLGLAEKAGAAAMQGISKIPAENFAKIFANPSELFTAPLKSTIAKAYGKVGFFAKEGIDEAVAGATASDRALLKSGINEIEKPFTEVDPSKLLDARKAADSMLDQAKFFGGPKQARSAITSKSTRIVKAREYLNYALDTLAELGNKDAAALRQADALASQGAAANSFRSLVPRVNVLQSLPRAATAPLAIPAVAGGVTALAGAAAKAAPFIGQMGLNTMASGANMGQLLADALTKNKKRR